MHEPELERSHLTSVTACRHSRTWIRQRETGSEWARRMRVAQDGGCERTCAPSHSSTRKSALPLASRYSTASLASSAVPCCTAWQAWGQKIGLRSEGREKERERKSERERPTDRQRQRQRQSQRQRQRHRERERERDESSIADKQGRDNEFMAFPSPISISGH